MQRKNAGTGRAQKKSKAVKPQMIAVGALAAVMVVGAAAFVGYRQSADVPNGAARSDAVIPAGTQRPYQTVASQAQAVGAATIYGFRSAHFGDDEKAIRAAIKKDFGVRKDKIAVRDNLVAGTRTLVVHAENLLPETGPAEIGYIIGYRSKGLTQVNVIWGTPVSASASGVQVAKTAVMLKSYFSKQGFDPKRIVADRRLRGGGILVFRASDKDDRLVQLVYREADLKAPSSSGAKKDDAASAAGASDDEAETGETAKVENSATKTGEMKKAYMLRLSYVLDPQHPDIIRIEKGAF